MRAKHFLFMTTAAILCLCLGSSSASAADPKFSAALDHDSIGLDETVSLKMSVIQEGSAQAEEPQFKAPDFEVVNEYNGTFIKSYYDNGRFGMQNERQITKVLKPLKTGHLSISSITVQVGGKYLKSNDLTVDVGQAGAGTPPPQNYNSGGPGLRNSSRRNTGQNIFVRAEVSKQEIYKGEQLVVSYYLYHRVKMFNIAADQFPKLNGFLREELELPITGQGQFTSDSVIVGGAPYEKSLLARYAAYPLQEGKLKIDPFALKYNYYAKQNTRAGDEEDPFSMFFQQMAPQSGESRSEEITVNVLPLPEEGMPASFSGGVGDFTVVSAIDKTEVPANQALTLTVKIEGRGNLAAVGEPKAKWPDTVEQYDSKGKAKMGKAGVGEKDFEFLLIPRAPGALTLPSLEFSFFDPAQKKYVTRSTSPTEIKVLPPEPGSALIQPKVPRSGAGSSNPATANGGASERREEIKPLKVGEISSDSGFKGLPGWRWLYWFCVGSFAIFISFVGYEKLKGVRADAFEKAKANEKTQLKSFDRLRASARAAASGAPFAEVVRTYELLTGAVLDAIDRKYAVGARSHSRAELKFMLVDSRGLPEEIWIRISKLLEFDELVRFALSAGAVSEAQARNDLPNWVSEGESIVQSLAKISTSEL